MNIKTTPLCLLAALAMLAGCKGREHKETQQAPPRIDVAAVVTDSVVLHKTYPGYLQSGTIADVVVQVDGRLLAKHYTSGSYVKKGQLLFTIDPTLYRDAAAQSQAQLESAISTRDYAKSHYEAVKKALEADAVSKMEVLSAESSLQQAEADIRNCQAALHTAQTNLGYCRVTAPVAGYITDSKLSAGNYISGSGAPVVMATIYDNSELKAVFQIEDAQYERTVGRTSGLESSFYRAIPLSFRENLLHSYTADLTYEAPNVEESTGTILLQGTVKNQDDELKNGMYVTVSLPYGQNPKAMVVKDAAIGTDQLGKYVYVVNDSNRIVYTHITVGEFYRDSLRIVDAGLKPGDRYVTRALLTVREGMEVDPVEADTPVLEKAAPESAGAAMPTKK